VWDHVIGVTICPNGEPLGLVNVRHGYGVDKSTIIIVWPSQKLNLSR
jgi:hypothetical protein